MAYRAGEVEVLLTVDDKDVARAEKNVKTVGDKIEKKPIKVAADTSEAVASAGRVESAFEQAFTKAAESGKIPATELVRSFLESERAASKSADEIEQVLVKSYAVAGDAAKELAKAAKGELHINVDAEDAIKSMDRVETTAKRLVSERAVVKLDADIVGAEKRLQSAQNRLEDLQVKAAGGLNVDADVRRAELQIKRIETQLDGMRKARTMVEVEADPTEAVQALQRVETEKQVVSKEVALRINANVANAEAEVEALRHEIDYLQSLSTVVDVEADVRSAESKLAGAEAALRDLQGARAEMLVEVDDGDAKSKLMDVADYAEDAGDDGGKRGGAALIGGIVAGLATIPIAGAVAKIAHTAADTLVNEFQSALQIEVRQDRLQALTGIDEPTAAKFARAAGEAYANNFGESIESNMNTARLALQSGLLDPKATTRDAQEVVAGLAGIADVLEEDIKPTATAVTTLMRTGLAKSSKEAFDLIAAGARNGLNNNEDLLDTLTEYPVVLQRLGLSGEEALGLINQGMEAGARNTDVLADALKEFQIRATDGSQASADGFARIGLSAEEMTAKIAAGGEGAREGLDTVLERLRDMEDPVQRNAAAVELFGTKAEDLGDALFALDLSTAVDSLDGVTGAAQRMFDTIQDNDASQIQRAQRNIEVAAEGIKGALASAFADPLGEAADWISQNRGPVLQFFVDLANGALDFGESMVESAAVATESLGGFVAGPLADITKGLAGFVGFFDGDAGKGLDALVEDMRSFDDVTAVAADGFRTNLTGAIEVARGKLNEFAEPQVALGYLNDASLRLAGAIDEVGYSASGAKLSLDDIDVAHLNASESGRQLEGQVYAAIAALGEEINAAAAAGESQDNLSDRYRNATGALVEQMTQMGLTEDQARDLINTILETPREQTTSFKSNSLDEKRNVESLADRIEGVPDKNVTIRADTSQAYNALNTFITDASGKYVSVNVTAYPNLGKRGYYGGVVDFMAQGGIPDLTPMGSIASMVSPNTWRVVGDRGDVPEAFIPLDGSERSWQILMETIRRMPGGPTGMSMTAGRTGESNTPPIQIVDNATYYSYDPHRIAVERDEKLQRALDAHPFMG